MIFNASAAQHRRRRFAIGSLCGRNSIFSPAFFALIRLFLFTALACSGALSSRHRVRRRWAFSLLSNIAPASRLAHIILMFLGHARCSRSYLSRSRPCARRHGIAGRRSASFFLARSPCIVRLHRRSTDDQPARTRSFTGAYRRLHTAHLSTQMNAER